MSQIQRNKKKIINDPVFGFINIQSEIVFDLIEHRYFQRLRRIKQLGLSYLVFPGANHSRFEHALGTVHLMRQSVAVLRLKGIEITYEEAEAVTIAILLHDIGHAPFSHVLENTLVSVPHEQISIFLMKALNEEFDGKLDLAIQIFTNNYTKKFLHQLVASQLDMDRLDYLSRDSFFTGVVEGTVGIDRIIKMLNVWNDQLVVDAKGIYSVEKFLISRRLMYWQVYLHKTVVSAELMLINVLKRARELVLLGKHVFATPALDVFLKHKINSGFFESDTLVNGKKAICWYTALDDNDVMTSIKEWQHHPDFVLSYLAKSITERKLFRVQLNNIPVTQPKIDKLILKISEQYQLDPTLASYFVFSGDISNNAYNRNDENINVLLNNEKIKDIREASDINLSVLTKTVRKYYLCFPKELDIN